MAANAASPLSLTVSQLAFTTLFLLLCLSGQASGVRLFNVSLGTGGEVQAFMTGGRMGGLCMLGGTNVGEAICAYLGHPPRATRAITSIFNGSTSLPIVGALNNCAHYTPDASGPRDLNNDCMVIPTEPSECRNNNRRLAVECHILIELRHGSASDGLVVQSLTGNMSTVCPDGIGMNEAAAVCRSLGFLSPERGYPVIRRFTPQASDEMAGVEALQCKTGDLLRACKWRPASAACRNSSSRLFVSCPSDPVTSKPLPSPSLLCNRQNAMVCFLASTLNSPTDLELAPSENHTICNVPLVINDTHICLNVLNYANCSQMSKGSGFNQYLLKVRFLGEKDNSSNYVRPPLEFNLFCRLSDHQLATGASLAPHFSTPTTAIDGHVRGTSVIEFYKDLVNGMFEQPIMGSVELGTVLYAAVLLQNADSNAWLVVNECSAADGNVTVSLVIDKCPTKYDVALIPVNATAMAVRFKAFLMSDNSTNGRIQLQCKTLACRLGDPSPDCSRACVLPPLASADDAFLQRQETQPAFLSVHRAGDGRQGAGCTAASLAAVLFAAIARAVAESGTSLNL